jgi:SAM-dependent methyltransferase
MTTLLPQLDRPASIRALRQLLADADYTTDGIKRLLHTEGDWVIGKREVPVHLRRLQGNNGVAAQLARLLLLSVPVAADAVERSLGANLGELEALGLVEQAGDDVRATVRLAPCDDLLIASDLHGSGGADHVAGVHRPSAGLQALTVRRPVERALDVGTGNGIQALLLARHAEHVVATDVNERALAFAAFNAALNGVENIEFRAGSFLEPVEGEQFDVVAANPPYVISPETEFVFRDSGLGRDRVSEQLVRALPSVLAEDGFATVMISWIQQGDEATAAPQRWLEESGCDAWLFHTALEDPLGAAASWNRDIDDPERFERQLDRWLEYFHAEEIGAIAYGALVLHRTPRSTWFRSVELPGGECVGGQHLELLFRAQDELTAAGDLLGAVVVPAAHTVFAHVNRSGPDGWRTTEAALTVRGGIPFQIALEPESAALVAALAPGRTAREAIGAAAATRGTPFEEFAPPALELLHKLVALGLLELVG